MIIWNLRNIPELKGRKPEEAKLLIRQSSKGTFWLSFLIFFVPIMAVTLLSEPLPESAKFWSFEGAIISIKHFAAVCVPIYLLLPIVHYAQRKNIIKILSIIDD